MESIIISTAQNKEFEGIDENSFFIIYIQFDLLMFSFIRNLRTKWFTFKEIVKNSSQDMSVKLSHKEDKNIIMIAYRESFLEYVKHVFRQSKKSL